AEAQEDPALVVHERIGGAAREDGRDVRARRRRAVVRAEERIEALAGLEPVADVRRRDRPAVRDLVTGPARAAVRAEALEERALEIDRASRAVRGGGAGGICERLEVRDGARRRRCNRACTVVDRARDVLGGASTAGVQGYG